MIQGLFGKERYITGDFWGGLAAMLVALPAAIAFGVTIYSAIGPSHAALGALAGVCATAMLAAVTNAAAKMTRILASLVSAGG